MQLILEVCDSNLVKKKKKSNIAFFVNMYRVTRETSTGVAAAISSLSLRTRTLDYFGDQFPNGDCIRQYLQQP